MSLLPRSVPRIILRRSYGTVQSSPSAASIASRIPVALQEATAATVPRTTWTREEVQQIYETPLNQLTYAAVCGYFSKLSRFVYCLLLIVLSI